MNDTGIEAAIKKCLPRKKLLGLDGFTIEFWQMFKGKPVILKERGVEGERNSYQIS